MSTHLVGSDVRQGRTVTRQQAFGYHCNRSIRQFRDSTSRACQRKLLGQRRTGFHNRKRRADVVSCGDGNNSCCTALPQVSIKQAVLYHPTLCFRCTCRVMYGTAALPNFFAYFTLHYFHSTKCPIMYTTRCCHVLR